MADSDFVTEGQVNALVTAVATAVDGAGGGLDPQRQSEIDRDLLLNWAPNEVNVQLEAGAVGHRFDEVFWWPPLSKFVALGYCWTVYSHTATSSHVWTSVDGVNWVITKTFVELGPDRRNRAGVSPTLMWAGPSSGTMVSTSTDAVNWTDHTPAAPVSLPGWQSLWVEELSLFFGTYWGAVIYSSPDGINWTDRAPAARDWLDVAWSPELQLLVAVGGDNYTAEGAAGQNIATSPDGITWTIQTGFPGTYWTGVIWHPGRQVFIATSASGPAALAVSSDGVSWQPEQLHPASATNPGPYKISYLPDLGYTIIDRYYNAGFFVSADGLNWFHGPHSGGHVWSPELRVGLTDSADRITSPGPPVLDPNFAGAYIFNLVQTSKSMRIHNSTTTIIHAGDVRIVTLTGNDRTMRVDFNELYQEQDGQVPGVEGQFMEAHLLIRGEYTGMTLVDYNSAPINWLEGSQPPHNGGMSLYRIWTYDLGVTLYGYKVNVDPSVALAAFEAKGDLLIGTAEGAFARLPVGANPDGYALVLDAAEPTGMKWGEVAAAGGSGISVGIDGTAADFASLPNGIPANEIYVTLDNSHAWISDGANGWTDLGTIQGPPGQDATLAQPYCRLSTADTHTYAGAPYAINWTIDAQSGGFSVTGTEITVPSDGVYMIVAQVGVNQTNRTTLWSRILVGGVVVSEAANYTTRDASNRHGSITAQSIQSVTTLQPISITAEAQGGAFEPTLCELNILKVA